MSCSGQNRVLGIVNDCYTQTTYVISQLQLLLHRGDYINSDMGGPLRPYLADDT